MATGRGQIGRWGGAVAEVMQVMQVDSRSK